MRRFSLLALAIALLPSLCQAQCMTCGPGGGMEFSPGMSAGSWSAGGGGGYAPYESVAAGGGGGGDQLYPYDSPEPWLHGYFQEIPAYGGYFSFRPHNYRHVLAQMQRAGRWGIDPTMPISHQWFHRYRQRAGMHPNFGTQHGSTSQPSYGNYANSTTAPNPAPAYRDPARQPLQHAGAVQRGYTGAAIPGIGTPNYQLSEVPSGRRMSDEYLTQLQQLNMQLEQQSFQIQSMQQQLNNRASVPQYNAPASAYGQPPMLGVPAPTSGYQAIPAPDAQPSLLSPPPAMRPAGPGPAYAEAPSANGRYSNPAPSGYPMNGQPMMHQPAPQPAMPAQPMLQMPTAPYGGSPNYPGTSTMIIPNTGVVPSGATMWQAPPSYGPQPGTYAQPAYPMNVAPAPSYSAPQPLGPVYGAQPAVPQQPAYSGNGYYNR